LNAEKFHGGSQKSFTEVRREVSRRFAEKFHRGSRRKFMEVRGEISQRFTEQQGGKVSSDFSPKNFTKSAIWSTL